MRDDRGLVVGAVETAQTFLTAVEVDALVGGYLAGMSVKSLAEAYGIHRATVVFHLRRRNVPSRRPGLGLDEKAEAVRLARAVSRHGRSAGWAWITRRSTLLPSFEEGSS